MTPDLRRLWQRYLRKAESAFRRVSRPPGQTDPVFKLPKIHANAMARLTDPGLVRSAQYMRLTMIERPGVNWVCHPEIKRFMGLLQKELRKRNIPFYVHSVLRTRAEQERLFANGVTKARAGQSPHNHGMACDLVHLTKGWNLQKIEWDIIGLIGKEVARKAKIKIQWGGEWKFYDPAHWELADWSNRVRNGEGINA